MIDTNVMKIFMTMAEMGPDTEEGKVAAQARILFATPGIIRPDNWDDLPLKEKKRRLELVKGVA